ncbi:MAG: FHA domain-containing protein [Bdellovibrionota bacterium]|nr:FHA domain-containing protein [Deltaproteobacteria bacterium]
MHDLPVKVTLTVIEGEDYQKTMQMTSPVLTIGRKNCEFRLNDTKVSTLHAHIEIHGENVFVIDQNSRNGITLNGETVEKAKLNDLDVIEIGFSKIQINIVDNLKAFKQKNIGEVKTVQKDISSLIDDELVRFSKWDLSSPLLTSKKNKQKEGEGLLYGLEVRQGPDKGKKYMFSSLKTSLGRGDVDCIFRDQDISRLHASIEINASSKIMTIIDEGSTNGMLVNGKEVKRTVLKPGDIVQMGQTLFIIVQALDE